MTNRDYTTPVDISTLQMPFRAGYKAAGYSSYGEFADDCSLPQSNVNKFLSGSLKNPGLFNVAAMAKAINSRTGATTISLDELVGIERQSDARCTEHAALMVRLGELEAACSDKDRLIDELRHNADLDGERLSIQRRALNDRRPLVSGLLAVINLLILLLAYVIIDASNPTWGIFRH